MLFPIGSVPNAPRLETRKALLMIDLQNDFLKKNGRLFVENAPQFLPKLPSLVERFREKGEVFWVHTEFQDIRPAVCPDVESYVIVLEESLDTQTSGELNSARETDEPLRNFKHTTRRCGHDDPEAFLARRHKKNWPRCCLPNTTGSELPSSIAEIVDPKKDSTIKKSDYSAFHTNSLLPILRTKLITKLYLCGSLSNISVYATALDAVQHGLEVTIVEDCVGYRNARCHEEAMRQMADTMGVNGIDYQELMDDLGGLLGDVVTSSTFQSSIGTRQADGDAVPENYSMRSKVKRWIDDIHDDDRTNGERSRSDGTDDVETGSAKRRSLGAEGRRKIASAGRNPDNAIPPPSLQKRSSDSNKNGGTSTPRLSPGARVTKARMRRSRVIGKPAHDSGSSPDPINQASATEQDPPNASDQARTGVIEADSDPDRCNLDERLSAVERVQAFSRTLRATKRLRPRGSKVLGPGDFIGERDSRIIYNFLAAPERLGEIFTKLSDETASGEVRWQKMFHCSGEVPRLVAVQGEVELDGSIPVYRHPADEPPPLLPFSPAVQSIRREVEKAIGHPFNHVLIQRYRGGEDSISEHSDKTLDIVRGSSIVNVSLGAMRTMTLRTKKSASTAQGLDQSRRASVPALGSKFSANVERAVQRVPLPHNSLFVLGQATNQTWLHAIRPDKRPASRKSVEELAFNGERISLTFRHIGTFVISDRHVIWGQGATCKTKEGARAMPTGDEASREGEKLIQAFGQENQQSHDFNWEEQYGSGFDVVDFTTKEDVRTTG